MKRFIHIKIFLPEYNTYGKTLDEKSELLYNPCRKGPVRIRRRSKNNQIIRRHTELVLSKLEDNL